METGRPRDVIDIDYTPTERNRGLPVEVLDRSAVLARHHRSPASGVRQRVGFHVLFVGTGGRGRHVVDYEPVEVVRGTVLHVHPGQVQEMVTSPHFDAHMVVWPVESDPGGAASPAWFPGGGLDTRWQLDDVGFERVLASVDELRQEQDRFRGSPHEAPLLRSMLRTLLLRVMVAAPATPQGPARVPDAFLALCQELERRLHERPSVTQLAQDLGYSTRTLDRACRTAVGLTAKHMVDRRVALELRRSLTHSDRAIGQIARDFSFDDPSNFAKFVRRHLGATATEIRDGD